MELRSDIAAAAARMTSAYDVNREIRHLAAYLREGETVQRLASGVYGAGAGLLGVTDHRVLLLRDGRSGHASEGFPVERLSSTEWVVDGGRGTITVSDSNSVAELREVPLADGEEVVGFIRALINRGDGGTSRPRRWTGTPAAAPPEARGSEPARANGNGRPVDPSAPYTSPSLPRVPVPPLNLPRRAAPAAATTFTESAVPVTLLSRTGTIPSQQPSAESSAPLSATPLSAAPMATSAPSTQTASLSSAIMPPASRTQATMPPAAPIGTQPTMSPIAPAAVPAGVHSTGATGAHAALGAPVGTGSVPPVNTIAGAPAHDVPGYPTTAMPSVPPAHEQLPPNAQPMLGGQDQHSDTIGIPSLFAGEVPVSQLAAEETATQIAVPPRLLGGAELSATTTTIGVVGKADAQPPEGAGAEQPAKDGEDGERPQPIVWRVPDQTMTGAVRRIRAETAEAIRPRRFEAKYRPATGTRPKKWIWLGVGAAALVALAAVGGTKLLAQHTDAPSPVNPAPAAVDAPAGQKATVTKVLDGDTVEVAGSEVNGTVEVLGIVAPRLDKNQCGAAAAKTFAMHTLENTPVTLVSDASQPATSRAGHRLAFLKLPDGSDYSVLATQEGMTRFYDSPQAAKMANDIKAAQAQAQGKHAGLWGSPCYVKASASGAGTTSTGDASDSPAHTTG